MHVSTAEAEGVYTHVAARPGSVGGDDLRTEGRGHIGALGYSSTAGYNLQPRAVETLPEQSRQKVATLQRGCLESSVRLPLMHLMHPGWCLIHSCIAVWLSVHPVKALELNIHTDFWVGHLRSAFTRHSVRDQRSLFTRYSVRDQCSLGV